MSQNPSKPLDNLDKNGFIILWTILWIFIQFIGVDTKYIILRNMNIFYLTDKEIEKK